MSVIERIKNHVLQPEARLKSVFTTKTKDKKWKITRTELRKAIEKGLDFVLSDEEFHELVTILDPGHSNMISCKEFLGLFSSDVNADVKARKAGIPIVNQVALAPLEMEKYKNLSGSRLKSKLKHYLNKNLNNVERGFLACDPDQCNLINPKLLRDVLENFCFPLTDEQFKEIMANFIVFRDRVNYSDFLNIYKKYPEEDTGKWVATVEKLAPFRSKQPPALAVEEVEEMLRDGVRTKKKGLLKDFKILDICKVGIAYKDDVRRLFNKYALRMNDHQFKTLWKDFPVNSFGQLIYEDFLEEYSKPKKKKKKIKEKQKANKDTTAVKKESSPVDKPVISSVSDDHVDKAVEPNSPNVEQVKNEITEHIASPAYFSQAQGDMLPSEKEEHELKERRNVLDVATNERRPTRVVPKKKWGQTAGGNESLKNAILKEAPLLKGTFDSMKIPILANFRALRHRFRRMDPKITGVVDFVAFQIVLRQSNVYLTDEEVFHVLEYFDPHLTGKINYRDFLRVFVWYA